VIKQLARWARTRDAVFLHDKVGLAVVVTAFLLISIVGWMVFRDAIFVITSTIMVAVLALAQRRIYQQVQLARHDQERLAGEQQRLQLQHYQQTEALFSLFSLIRPNQPLPSMGDDWSIAPDLANVIIALIRERKPALIVEAGSGVSTLLAAYALRDVGRGTIVSLEHDHRYWTITRRHINHHGLEAIATVHYAPLTDVVVNGEKWLWYDTSMIEGVGSIDMLIVDGPPGQIRKWARYPALPLLFDRLSNDAVVLLDDTGRQDEHELVEAWSKEFPYFEIEPVQTIRGGAIMRRDRAGPIAPRASVNLGFGAPPLSARSEPP
jgi:predicted O-methyltransferase YrrM